MKKDKINNIEKLNYPDVRPLLDTNKQVIVHLEPSRIATIVGLFFTLIVLFIFLIVQLSGRSIAVGSMLVLCALTFVITYGIAGILTYYSLWLVKTTQNINNEKTETTERKTQE